MGAQTDIPVLAATPEDKRVLILGSGIGAVALGLRLTGIDREIVCVDYSERAMKICEAVTDSAESYTVMDAANFVRQESGFFDYIVVDLFDGPELCDFVTSPEFLQSLLSLLNEQGCLVVNTLGIPPHLRLFASDSWADDFDTIAAHLALSDPQLQFASVPHIINRTLIVSRNALEPRLDLHSRRFRVGHQPARMPLRIPAQAIQRMPAATGHRPPHSFADFRNEVRASKARLAETLFPNSPSDSLNETVASMLADREIGAPELYRLANRDADLVYLLTSQYHTTSWQRRNVDWSWLDASLQPLGPAHDYLDWHAASAQNAVLSDKTTSAA